MIDVKNTKICTIPINSARLFTNVEKNALKLSVEEKRVAKEEANHRDLVYWL